MRRFAPVGLVLAGCLSGGGHANSPAREVTGGVAEPVGEGAVAKEEAPVVAPSGRAMVASEVICGRAVRCGTIGRSQLEECLKGPGASRMTLVWGYEDRLGIPALVAAGRLKKVEGSVEACLEFLAKAGCWFDRTQAPKGCGYGAQLGEYAPGVPPGGVCTRWEECIDGFCTAQTACEGVCKARSPIGGMCDSDQICGDDAFCWEGTCRARAGAGEECGGHWQWCREGLWCEGYQAESENVHHWRPARNGKCSPGRGEGESCVPEHTMEDELCRPGLFCNWGEDRPVCRKPLGEGDECGWMEACGEGLACVGLKLGGSHPAGHKFGVRARGRCGRTLDAGDACDPQAFVSGCPRSMVCDEQKKVCRGTGLAGDPCVSSWITKQYPNDVPLRTDSCFSSHYCEVKTRTCRPQVASGERCVPQKFGVEDDPCFLGKCDEKTRRCKPVCG